MRERVGGGGGGGGDCKPGLDVSGAAHLGPVIT